MPLSVMAGVSSRLKISIILITVGADRKIYGTPLMDCTVPGPDAIRLSRRW